MKGFRFAGALALLLAAAGGVSAQNAGQGAAAPADQSFTVRGDDPEMNAAKRRAIAELPDFYRHMTNPAQGERDFQVKFDIAPGDERTIYVWAGELDRSRSPMVGTLMNQPNTGHRMGDRVTIREEDIIDWSYYRGPVLIGSHTERVLLGRMPPEAAARMREAYGW